MKRMKLWCAVCFTVMACGGAVAPSGGTADAAPDADAAPVSAPCVAPPIGFIDWRSGDSVDVSKKLSGSAGGVRLYAEIRSVPFSSLPAQVDFGDELIEVRADLSLCLLDR